MRGPVSTSAAARRKVARLEDLTEGEATAVDAGDRELALYRVDCVVYATDNLCTHGEARLCDGYLEGYGIECPLHQGMFDIRTGAAMREPAETAIATYPVEIEDGEVYVVVGASGEHGS
jgi:naphthalene 1,2-dioxygenase ferredoxin component